MVEIWYSPSTSRVYRPVRWPHEIKKKKSKAFPIVTRTGYDINSTMLYLFPLFLKPYELIYVDFYHVNYYYHYYYVNSLNDTKQNQNHLIYCFILNRYFMCISGLCKLSLVLYSFQILQATLNAEDVGWRCPSFAWSPCWCRTSTSIKGCFQQLSINRNNVRVWWLVGIFITFGFGIKWQGSACSGRHLENSGWLLFIL